MGKRKPKSRKKRKRLALHKLTLGNQRENMKEQGFFDGRFKEKTIADKKKTQYKKLRKKKIKSHEI